MRPLDMHLSIHPRLIILGHALRPTKIALLYLLRPKTQIMVAAMAPRSQRLPCLLLLLHRIMLRNRSQGKMNEHTLAIPKTRIRYHATFRKYIGSLYGR